MTDAQSEYERFAATAGEYGVELTRVPEAEVPDAVAGHVEAPAVGAPLPWEGVSLPGCVTTDPTPADLDAAVTGVTGAAFAVADYGSFVLESTPGGNEPVSLFPERHVVVLREEDVVPDMAAAFDRLGERVRATRGSAVLATGPSATADMGALVHGAHGPRAVAGVVVT